MEWSTAHTLRWLLAAKLSLVSHVVRAVWSSLLWWALLNALVCLYVGYRLLQHHEPKKRAPQTARKFRFLDSKVWLAELNALSVDAAALDAACIPESFLISEQLDLLTNLVISQFVDLWFTKVSQNSLFQDSIRAELKSVVVNLKARLAALDMPKVLVFQLLPIFTNHYARFVQTQNLHAHSYSIESKLATAQKFNAGQLHRGVSKSATKEKEKEYFRKHMDDVLPLLLSPKERENAVVVLLLREILACTVLTSVFEVLAEGDFFNQMIVKFIGTSLQHRNQVKRLRAALQQHTSQATQKDSAESTLNVPSLQLPLTDEQVGQWLTYIDNCREKDSASVAKYLQHMLSSTDSRDENGEKLAKIVERFRAKFDKSLLDANSLEEILSNYKLAAVFREFLRSRQREAEYDLWLAIELMKAPLEDSNSTNVSLMLEFSNQDDIRRIYNDFFDESTLDISPQIKESVASYVRAPQKETNRYELYLAARKALFSLQDDVFEHMRTAHFSAFQHSNRYGDLDMALPKASTSSRREVSVAFRKTGSSREAEDKLEDQNANAVAVQAIESAFAKIMNSTNLSDMDLFANDLTIYEHPHLTESGELSQSSILFGSHAASSTDSRSNPASNRLSALFETISDDSDSESAHSDSFALSTELSDSQLKTLEILLAAPGDLSLAEKIATLDNDIENLNEQHDILTSLLKKAELTNNLNELKILKRSKTSVENEISSKELQKQQYIVQENENSLYGKSKVQIQSCVFGNDKTSQYVLYIVEVQKYSSDNPNEIVAGWVVARRFSQFYRLNEYLKIRYPELAAIKFPKKTVPYLGKFKKSQLFEIRKPMLEAYLRELLKIPDVCSDPAFRSFLSSEDFRIGSGKISPENTFDVFLNRFYLSMGKTRVPVQSTKSQTPRTASENMEILENIKEMERELKQFDEIEKNDTGNIPFVKPVSDLVLTIFDLSNKSWLRGRALLVILQQVLGSAIEKTIINQVENNLKREEKIIDVLNLLTNMLFPDGKFRETPEQRTKAEQTSTRQEAFLVLKVFMNETCSTIFGSRNTNAACTHLLEMVQNDFLNKHLMFEMLDELLYALFPEVTAKSAIIHD